MDWGRRDPGCAQLARYSIGGALGPAEHEGLPVLCDQLGRELNPIGSRHAPEVVRDVGRLRRFRMGIWQLAGSLW